jgi:hypothetical protein
MRNLGRDDQLNGQSHAEIQALLKEATGRLARRKVRFFHQKLKNYHLLNGLVVWFSELDDARQEAIGREAVARLEVFVREENATAKVEAAPPAAEPDAAEGRGEGPGKPAKRKPKKGVGA